MYIKNGFNKAFTMLELSVSIVIISMIAAVVVASVSMMKNAKIRGVLSEKDKHIVAVKIFFEKYKGYPGDIANASSYWSGATNGDGDKLVEANDEVYRAWEHLALADMVEGSYTGTHTGGVSVKNVNVPETLWDDVVVVLRGSPDWTLDYSSNYKNGEKNHLIFGKVNTANSPYPWQAFLRPGEAHGIDLKVDDELPGTGHVVHRYIDAEMPVSSSCVSTDGNANTTTYLSTGDGIFCSVVFIVE